MHPEIVQFVAHMAFFLMLVGVCGLITHVADLMLDQDWSRWTHVLAHRLHMNCL